MQAKFKSRNEYVEWRSHWRKSYRRLGAQIHDVKGDARKPTNNAEAQGLANSSLRTLQMQARSMMIAREMTDGLYAFRKARVLGFFGKMLMETEEHIAKLTT